MESTIETVNCRVCCRNTDTQLILEYRGIFLKKCLVCGTRFSENRILKERLFELSKNSAPSMFNDPLLGKKKELARMTEARWQLDLIEEYIKPGKIFDVGAAGGTFLSIARARKWQITGNEISDACIYIAKRNYDIDLYKGFLEDTIADSTYSAVTLWNVLEHLYEPINSLTHIYNMLTKDGVILIKVPLHNEETIKADHMLPDHVFNFDEHSLDYLLSLVKLYRVKSILGYDGTIPTLVSVIKKNGE